MSKKDKENVILKRFGRYLILDHLVDGGMAKICRARFLTDQANKIVAIKMIQPQYSKNDNFRKMFLDEIKVTFGLIHPNIAQIYDSGMIDDQLFTVMEYVDGANLKQFLDRLKERNFVFPIEISIYIVSQICQALSYAHNFTDKLTGKQLKIIHRDISPHNVMITYDGAVKVIDFGIAKSDTNSESTQAGTIKGKLSYLAPEYLEDFELDHRYDQFSVGITLWELLCSRKLFKSPNELGILKKIQACKIPPPSSINPNVSKELDAIVLKVLSKDRELRYKDMDQLNRALVKLLYSNFPDFNATDLSYFAKELFKEDIKEDRKKLRNFGQLDISPYMEELKEGAGGENSSSEGATSKKKPYKINSGRKSDEAHRELDFGFDKSGKPKKKEGEEEVNVAEGETQEAKANDSEADDIPPQAPDLDISEGVDKVTSIDKTKRKLPDSPPGKTRVSDAGNLTRSRMTNSNRTLEQQKTRTRMRHNTQVNMQHPPKTKIRIAPFIVIGLSILIYYNFIDKGRDPANVPDPITTIEPKTKDGLITFTNFNFEQKVTINGRETIPSAIGEAAYLNREIIIRVTEKNKKDFVKKFTLTEKKPNITIDIPEMPVVKRGELISGRNYGPNSKLRYELDGEVITKNLPIRKAISLPVGRYPATVINEFEIEKEIEFEIKENERVKLPES